MKRTGPWGYPRGQRGEVGAQVLAPLVPQLKPGTVGMALICVSWPSGRSRLSWTVLFGRRFQYQVFPVPWKLARYSTRLNSEMFSAYMCSPSEINSMRKNFLLFLASREVATASRPPLSVALALLEVLHL
ncbi:hypothetical protein C0Q61_09210 [Streptomyces albidoflavus]|nr:hypothetical protein C0Q61_09210 [Streptomyces albidoflavus]